MCFVVGRRRAVLCHARQGGHGQAAGGRPPLPLPVAAACTIRGRVTGQWARGTATRVSGGEADEALRLHRKKYGISEALARLATRSKGGIAVYRLDFGLVIILGGVR